MTETSRRNRLIVPMLLLATILAASIPAIWFGARLFVTAAIEGWFEQERSFGRYWACAGVETGGFPFRLDYACRKPKLPPTPASPLAIEGESIVLSASLFDPMLIRATLQGPLQLIRRDGANATLDWKTATLDLRFGFDALRDASIHVEGLEATTADIARNAHRVGISKLDASARGLDAARADIAIDAPQIDAPDLALLTGAVDLAGLRFAGKLDHPDEIDFGFLPRGLEPWRASGGALDIERLSMTQGAMSIALDGRVELDARHRASGGLNLAAAGIEPILRRFGLIPPALSTGGFLGSLLAGKPGPDGQTPTLKLPLTLRDGAVLVGPIRAPVALLPLY